jgi:integrase
MPKKINRNPGISRRGSKWQARAFYEGKEFSKSFATQDEAIRWKREQERSLERGEWINPSLSSITFSEWSQMWLNAKTDITPSTRRGYIARIDSHLLPTFGKRKLTSISNNEIGQWIAKSIESGVGLTAIKQSHGVMRQILKSAVLDGRLNRNVAEGVSIPRLKPKEKQALSLNQLRALAEECGDFKSLVLFAGTTGLRWGEIAALQCKDISVLNRTVFVGKAYSSGLKGEKILGGTKTHQNRTVPLTKEIVLLLEKLVENKGPETHLFQMPGYGSLDYNNFMTRVFRPAVVRAGLQGVGFHSLRHTTASLLISQGTPVTAVSKILGHASTQMTLDVYGHLYEDDASKYIDRLGDSLFGEGPDKERTNVLSATQKVRIQ